MSKILAKEIEATDINKVVSFTIPNPVLAATSNKNSYIHVTGVLTGFVRSSIGNDLILHVGNGAYVINDVFQEILEISFPTGK